MTAPSERRQALRQLTLEYLRSHARPLADIVGHLWGDEPLNDRQRHLLAPDAVTHPHLSERELRIFIGEQLLAEARERGQFVVYASS